MTYFYLSEQLNTPYKEVFEQAEFYASIKDIAKDEVQDALLNLFDLLYSAQVDQKPVEDVIGGDVDAFCKAYFGNRHFLQFLHSLPKRFYSIALWIFGLETFFFLGDFFIGEPLSKIDLFPYLVGQVLFLISIPLGHLLYRYGLVKYKLKVGLGYCLLFLLGLLFIWGGLHLNSKIEMLVPRFWFLGLLLTYIVPYKAIEFYRNLRKFGTYYDPEKKKLEADLRLEKKTVENSLSRRELIKLYAKQYKSKKKKGMSSKDFYRRMEKEIKRNQQLIRWKWGLVFATAIPFVLPVYFTDPLLDALLFTVLEVGLSGLIMSGVVKLIRSGLAIRQSILKEAAPYQDDLEDYFKELG